MQLDSMFISKCDITLHVSDAFCIHPQEHLKTVVAASGALKNCSSSLWCMTWDTMTSCGSHRPWTPLLDTSPRIMS